MFLVLSKHEHLAGTAWRPSGTQEFQLLHRDLCRCRAHKQRGAMPNLPALCMKFLITAVWNRSPNSAAVDEFLVCHSEAPTAPVPCGDPSVWPRGHPAVPLGSLCVCRLAAVNQGRTVLLCAERAIEHFQPSPPSRGNRNGNGFRYRQEGGTKGRMWTMSKPPQDAPFGQDVGQLLLSVM